MVEGDEPRPNAPPTGDPPTGDRAIGTAAADEFAGVGGWVLAAAFGAVVLRWVGPLNTVEAIYLATLLVLLPRLAGAQISVDDPVLELDRRAIYLQSALMLLVLGGMGFWLGVARGGLPYLRLDEFDLGRDSIWALGLTAGAMALMAFVWTLRRLGSTDEAPLVRHLLPKTGPEKRAFAGLSVMAGVGEEIAYRGFALTALIEVTGLPLFSAVITSVSFGWVHAYQGIVGMLRAGLLGLLFCVPVLFLGTLWPAMAAHTLVDWISGLVLGERLLGPPPESAAEAREESS